MTTHPEPLSFVSRVRGRSNKQIGHEITLVQPKTIRPGGVRHELPVGTRIRLADRRETSWEDEESRYETVIVSGEKLLWEVVSASDAIAAALAAEQSLGTFDLFPAHAWLVQESIRRGLALDAPASESLRREYAAARQALVARIDACRAAL